MVSSAAQPVQRGAPEHILQSPIKAGERAIAENVNALGISIFVREREMERALALAVLDVSRGARA